MSNVAGVSTAIINGLSNKALQLAFNVSEQGRKVCFRQFGTAVAVSGEATIVALLSSYMHYEQPLNPVVDLAVHLVESSSYWDTVCAALSPVDWSPVLDYGDFGKILATDEVRLVAYRSLRAVCVLDRINSQVCIVAPSTADLFVAGYKAVRQLLTGACLTRGGRVLHASGVEIDGRALLVVGPKGAGKSTALMQLLSGRVEGLRYLANDRILLWKEAGALVAGCWPTVAGFGVGTLKSIPGLEGVITPELYIRAGGASLLLLDFKRMDPDWAKREGIANGKVRLNPMDLACAFGMECASSAKVTVVVASALEPVSTSTLSELSGNDVLAAMLENEEVSVRNHPAWLDWPPADGSVQPHTRWSMEDALSGIRGFRLTGGSRAAEPLRALAALMGHGDLEGEGVLRYHDGVYALIRSHGKVLVVRKTRGPYKGWLDLPGGGREVRESAEAALKRELREELGALVRLRGEWQPFSLLVTTDSEGKPIRFVHQGVLAEVVLSEQGTFAPTKQDEDVSEVLWVATSELRHRADVSALLRHALLSERDGD